MKYLKTYEENIEIPKVGDYVILDLGLNSNMYKKIVVNFIINNIGKITHIDKGYDIQPIEIIYNIPEDLKNIIDYNLFTSGLWYANYNDIKFFDSNKKSLELKILANKYNI